MHLLRLIYRILAMRKIPLTMAEPITSTKEASFCFLIKQTESGITGPECKSNGKRIFTFKGKDTSENESGTAFDNLSGQRLNSYRLFGKHYRASFSLKPGKTRNRQKKTDFYDVNRDYLGIRCFLIEGRKCYVIWTFYESFRWLLINLQLSNQCSNKLVTYVTNEPLTQL